MALVKLLPLAVDAGVGAIDGFLSVRDTLDGLADAWGRPQGTNSYLSLKGVWAEAGALAGGIVLGMQRYNSDLADSLVQSGTALLGKRAGAAFALSNAKGGTWPNNVASTATPRFVSAGHYTPGPQAMRAPQYISTRQKPRILS